MTVGMSSANWITPVLRVWRGGGNGANATAPATLYVQLHTADPGASGTSNVSVGSTSRQAITFNDVSSNAISMASIAGTWSNGGTSETLTHISVFSASSAGTFYWSAALSSSQPWASGNTFTLTGSTLTGSPVAA